MQFQPNDQAHRRQWSAAELLSSAAPCYLYPLRRSIGDIKKSLEELSKPA